MPMADSDGRERARVINVTSELGCGFAVGEGNCLRRDISKLQYVETSLCSFREYQEMMVMMMLIMVPRRRLTTLV